MDHFFGEEGFSILEVMVGLIILAIGILAIAGLQITSIRETGFSARLTQASVIAQDRLEFLKSLPLNDSRMNAGDYPEDTRAGLLTGSYHVEIKSDPDFVTIHYTVSWTEKGIPHAISFKTIKAN